MADRSRPAAYGHLERVQAAIRWREKKPGAAEARAVIEAVRAGDMTAAQRLSEAAPTASPDTGGQSVADVSAAVLDLDLNDGSRDLDEVFEPIAARIEYSLRCTIEVGDEPRRVQAQWASALLWELCNALRRTYSGSTEGATDDAS